MQDLSGEAFQFAGSHLLTAQSACLEQCSNFDLEGATTAHAGMWTVVWWHGSDMDVPSKKVQVVALLCAGLDIAHTSGACIRSHAALS